MGRDQTGVHHAELGAATSGVADEDDHMCNEAEEPMGAYALAFDYDEYGHFGVWAFCDFGPSKRLCPEVPGLIAKLRKRTPGSKGFVRTVEELRNVVNRAVKDLPGGEYRIYNGILGIRATRKGGYIIDRRRMNNVVLRILLSTVLSALARHLSRQGGRLVNHHTCKVRHVQE